MKRVDLLPENVLLNKVYWCQIDQKHVKRLGSLLGFPFKKTS